LFLVLLVATAVFYYTPQACLAAVTLTGAVSLFDLHSPQFFWKYSRMDFGLWLFMLILTVRGTALLCRLCADHEYRFTH
jgi:MFS superfamily sulfate permease-like transporter